MISQILVLVNIKSKYKIFEQVCWFIYCFLDISAIENVKMLMFLITSCEIFIVVLAPSTTSKYKAEHKVCPSQYLIRKV